MVMRPSDREIASQYAERGRRWIDCVARWESGERSGERESTFAYSFRLPRRGEGGSFSPITSYLSHQANAA
jgi:hypothetical protein